MRNASKGLDASPSSVSNHLFSWTSGIPPTGLDFPIYHCGSILLACLLCKTRVKVKWASDYKEGTEGRSSQELTLGPGLASTVEVVPVVDVSLTMLEGLWFLSCFNICGFGLWGDVGESSE